MSGGSYNYLYSRELIDDETRYLLRLAHDRMAALPYAAHAAGKIQELLSMAEEITRRKEGLSEVLRCLEWWESNDYSEDQFREALDEFHAQVNPAWTKTEQRVWAAWNALSDSEPSPVKRIAKQFGMAPADVASIVYPMGQRWGRWEDDQEPDV
jgi:hypothetical protein